MIKLASIKECTGCLACYNSCTHHAINIIKDDEGFWQPTINSQNCIECGLCMKKCPEINVSNFNKIEPSPKVYAVINYEDRFSSSSGGAFSLFARWVIKKGGVVYGATMDNLGNVKHIHIESIQDLKLLKGSKYVQSYLGESYKEIRSYLNLNRPVLFVGTACQVSGLYSFLGKQYQGLLYTIDLICHGVPSNDTFKSYIKHFCNDNGFKFEDFETFGFRKLDGWAYCPSVKFAKAKRRYLELHDNAFMNAYFKGLLFRECCYNCNYCNLNRIGTFTIADFWGIGKNGVRFNKNISNGVSLVIDNKNILPQLTNVFVKAYIEERDLNEVKTYQDNLCNASKRNVMRDTAVRDMLNPNISLKHYSIKYGLPHNTNLIGHIQIKAKHLLIKCGLFNILKCIMYKIK